MEIGAACGSPAADCCATEVVADLESSRFCRPCWQGRVALLAAVWSVRKGVPGNGCIPQHDGVELNFGNGRAVPRTGQNPTQAGVAVGMKNGGQAVLD